MNNLLVPFDGSDSALRALDHAIALARATGAAVHVVHVYEEPAYSYAALAEGYGGEGVFFPREELLAWEEQHSRALLDGAAARLAAGGVRYTTTSRLGQLPDTLLERAKELHCDAIVMGTHGRTAWRTLIMGSVASKVVHAAQIPVTLVR